jgi:hypothetical protein
VWVTAPAADSGGFLLPAVYDRPLLDNHLARGIFLDTLPRGTIE